MPMMRAACRGIAPLALVLLAAGPLAAKPGTKVAPKVVIRTPDQAVKLLSSPSEEAQGVAAEWLSARTDLLQVMGRALYDAVSRAPTDVGLASRVLGLVADRGDEGCTFIGGLLDAKRPGWTEAVLFRQAEPQRCPAVSDGLARILKDAPDTRKDAASVQVVTRVLDVVRTWKDATAARTACRHLLAGPGTLRSDALATLLAARPPEAGECVVQTYAEETPRADSDGAFRAALLKGLAKLGGTDAVPTLRLALDRLEDRDLACGLLDDRGDAGVEGLVFALRTGDARSEGVKACLMTLGVAALPRVIPLMEHPSPRVRAFVIDFLARHHSPAARDYLQTRFLGAPGIVDRGVLLGLLALYPAGEVGEPVKAALSDPEARMRRAGLDAVEATRALDLLPTVHAMAEEDPDPALKRRSLEVCWRLGDAGVVPLARRQATYEEPSVVAMALRLLAFLGGADDVKSVAAALKHRDADVVKAAREAAWVMGLAEPRKGKVEWMGAPKAKGMPKAREVSCGGATAQVLGKKGPVVLVLPGGPGMDQTWSRPWLHDLADDAVVAFVTPDGTDATTPGAAGLVSPEQVRCLAQSLGGGPVVLVSHGLGGTWALSLAAKAPEAVAGVAALMAPLPGRLDDLDEALKASLTEPFGGLALRLTETQQRFAPAALDRYLARVFAVAMAGKADEPERMLAVAWNVLRDGRAYAWVSRPDVKVEPAASTARMLLVTPPGLPPAPADAYRTLAASAPDRVTLASWDACGHLPEVACTGKVLKALAALVEASTARGRK
jgi:pimeloyl-ACP methyl ester carboxylesterase